MKEDVKTKSEDYSADFLQALKTPVPDMLYDATMPKGKTVGCRWIKRDGQWWKYYRRDYGFFLVEVPAYFETFAVYYAGSRIGETN